LPAASSATTTTAPSFADGLQVQVVLAAVERSVAEGTWQDVVVPA